ncbi:1-(5-phosphoribosyl)-5-[(5-phosphoribosylamino)methylideneamino]imidazole-4-carboxamide isomerase [Ruminococcaceae bacterium OttesenSCG-928-A16]|nr:1-(5-phosphoribosyl)-5-[(5-phosphoribosylamino)methylideneamino]imidazole-4-carboxamide isomerase [Ruminococcaceae bacterium OttesenSCG-928-A16]
MLIYPAIDLLGGKAVRLYQGDYDKVEVFGNDPAAFAAQFAAAGANHLHVVDLDGAKQGTPQNFAAVQAIASTTGMFIELGGGIRTQKMVEQCFAAGIGRVILGTAALKDPIFTRSVVKKYGDKIAIGVDARDGKVAIEGWLATSETDSFDFCREMRDIGVNYIIYTDISRDGTGKGANLEVYGRLAEIEGLNITASGGVSSLEDVRQLKEMGLYAAILGRALYTGAVHLAQAVQLAKA